MSESTDTNMGQRFVEMVIRFIGYLIYAYLIFVEIILFLGFFLLLFGANPSSGFVEWIYRSVDRAMRPFRGIFEPIELGTTGADVPAVFDTSILFAMMIYGILAVALKALLDWLTGRINRIDRENRLRAQQAAYEAAATATPGYPVQPTPTSDPSAAAPSADPNAASAAADPSATGTAPPPPPPPPATS